jgi:Mrp family chromosome partitioning ATPase
VAGIGAYIVASRGGRDYQAVALLRVNESNLDQAIIGIGDTDFKPIENVLAEIPPEIEQYRVAQRAVEFLQLEPFLSPNQVLGATDVAVDRNNGLIKVGGASPDPQDAAAIANSVSRAYVDIRRHTELARIRRARIELQRIARARARRAASDPAVAADVRSLTDRVEQLRLTERIRPESVSLVRAAGPPSSPTGISPRLLGLAGAALGFVLGIALAALREQTDRRIRSLRALERALGVGVLARIPLTRRLRKHAPLERLGPREREPFRLLLARLRNDPDAGSARSIAITSATKDEGKSTTAWYLAATAAADGASVLLVEADLTGPVSTNGAAGAAGLADVLAARAPLFDAVRPVETGAGRFEVISGGGLDASTHLAAADAVDRMLDRAEGHYDLVVISVPPLTVAADAVPFVRRAGGVVVVARQGSIDRDSAEELRGALAGIDASLVGAVAVGFDRPESYP